MGVRAVRAAVLTLAGALVVIGCTSPVPQDQDPPPSQSPDAHSAESVDPSAAAGGSTDPDDPFALTDPGPMPPPSSSQLVQDAVAAGELDEPTGLLYRIFAQFNDPRLPEQFHSDTPTHDIEALREAVTRLDTLPDEIADDVRPYLLRPTDPDSAFSSSELQGDASADTGGQIETLGAGSHAPAFVQASNPPADRQCRDTWYTQASASTPFRAWVCGSARGEDNRAEILGQILDRVDLYAPELTRPVPEGMGPPIPDHPDDDRHFDGDDKIDLYVLDPGWFGPDRTWGRETVGDSFGVAVPTPPVQDSTSSGYIFINAAVVDAAIADGSGSYGAAELDRTIVHEIFHVLQFAHHFGIDGWFVEGTATWAELHFVPEHSEREHRARFGRFQPYQESLLVSKKDADEYAAYAWPLFMEQETDPTSVFGTWGRLHGTGGTNVDVLDAIDHHVPVAENFHEFTMRVFNLDLPGDPINPRFVHVAPEFPDGALFGEPDTMPKHDLVDAAIEIDHTGVPGLGRRYHRIVLGGPPDEMVGVRVTTELSETGAPTVEAVVRDDHDRFRRIVMPIGPDGSEFCTSHHFALVVSNADLDPEATFDGHSQVERVDNPDCDLDGDLGLNFNGLYEGPPDEVPATHRASVDWRGTLHVTLTETQTDQQRIFSELEELEELGDFDLDAWDTGDTVYSGAGSRWQMQGSFHYERCVSPGFTDCRGQTVTQHFSADTELSDDGPDGSGSNGWLRVVAEDDELLLQGSLPVTVTTEEHVPGQSVISTTEEQLWPITCYDSGSWLYLTGSGGIYTESGPSWHDGAPGAWTDSSQSAMTFDCHQQWDMGFYGGDGESGPTTFTLSGTVDLD